MEVLSGVFLVSGAIFMLLSGVGMVRFHDTFERIHAASKATSLGIVLVGLGAVLVLDARSAAAVALVVVLSLITVPISSHLVGLAAHKDWRELQPAEMIDDLTAHQESVEKDDAGPDGE